MINHPPPSTIRAAMAAIGHTQPAMARDMQHSLRAVESWLAEPGSRSHRPMHPELFSRYLAKHGLIPGDGSWEDWEG